MPRDDSRICPLCRHAKRPTAKAGGDWLCTHPEADYSGTSAWPTCSHARRPPGFCGPDGEFWEPVSEVEI